MSQRTERLFARVIRLRWWIVAAYLLLTPPALWLALHVPSDTAIDRLIVENDPDAQRTAAFHRLFPEGKHILLLLESDEPFRADRLQRMAELERRLQAIANVKPFSARAFYERLHPDFAAAADGVERFSEFVTGTELFARQGLVGRRYLAIAVALTLDDNEARDTALDAIDTALAQIDFGDRLRVRKVGGPYVDSWLEHETHRSTQIYMPMFGLFLIGLILFLYRSWRALLALLISLAVAVLLAVAAAPLVGFGFTIVSTLVPLTVLITTTANLVYIHSRFVDRPEQRGVDEHQAFSLANKLLACSASVFAAATGFAALAVSEIRPIRQLGEWTALGLLISWLVSFTLFPALQKILATPTGRAQRGAGRWFAAVSERIPAFSYRRRWGLVLGSLLLMGAGAIALLGLPGAIEPMRLEVDALDYIDPAQQVYQDTRFFEAQGSGLSMSEVWIKTQPGAITQPQTLAALDRFASAIEREPGVGSVVGVTTLLRFKQYAAGAGDRFPSDPAAVSRLAADLENLLIEEPEFGAFVNLESLADTHLTLIGSFSGSAGYDRLRQRLESIWKETAVASGGLDGCSMELTGQGLLQAKIAGHLVPTLTESFALTAAIIFVTFIVVFRSGAARLMAMIPSLFAILVMFLVMRLTGMALNVATILIASTVLGASENDQIHFFYHFGERRNAGGSCEQSLRHTLRVSGTAILYATLINASGFLALALSPLPPMRQFGVVSSCAFLLSMLADFTALPASLWIVFRERLESKGG